MKAWIVFFNRNTGDYLLAYDLVGTYAEEMEATVSLLASEKNLREEDIVVELHYGKGSYVLGEGQKITEEDIVFSEEKFEEILEKAVQMVKALPKEPKTAKLSYVGMGEFDMPAYKDEMGRIFLDTNLGHGEPDLCRSSNNELDGEPDSSISSYYDTWSFESRYEPEPRQMDYVMLGRLKSDCEYALYAAEITGKLCLNHLYYKSIEKHIEEMKKLYNSFPVSKKPVWIIMDDICNYERKMKMVGGENDEQ